MLILSLFILQALSAGICYDLELQGMLKIGKDFLNILRQRSPAKDPVKEPQIDVSSNNMGDPLEHVEMFRSSNVKSKQIRNVKQAQFYQLLKHFQKKGIDSLNDVALLIRNDLNMEKILSPTLEVVTDDYVNALQNYYDFLINKQTYMDPLYDMDSVYLDFAETSCRLLYNEQKKLLNDIIMHEDNDAKNYKNYKFNTISNKLLKLNKKHKREAIKAVCKTCDVCRDYPAFTDYCPDIINEVLNLTETEFRSVLGIVTDTLEQNSEIFAKITEKKDRELIRAQLKGFSENLLTMKEFLELLSTLMTHRFKIVSIGSEEFKMKTKAAKILLDIINKAVSQESDIVQIDFDNFVQAMRNWAGGNRSEIKEICESFMKNSLRRLQYNLTKNAKEEIRALIKTIMRGNTTDDEVFQRLFHYGSAYVKNEDFHSDIESLTF